MRECKNRFNLNEKLKQENRRMGAEFFDDITLLVVKQKDFWNH